jgi:DNA topoisomerase-3
VKNYSFEFDFGQSWGRCGVTMTCVSGHLTQVDFGPEYKNWSSPPPEALFNAPIVTSVHDVSRQYSFIGDSIY